MITGLQWHRIQYSNLQMYIQVFIYLFRLVCGGVCVCLFGCIPSVVSCFLLRVAWSAGTAESRRCHGVVASSGGGVVVWRCFSSPCTCPGYVLSGLGLVLGGARGLAPGGGGRGVGWLGVVSCCVLTSLSWRQWASKPWDGAWCGGRSRHRAVPPARILTSPPSIDHQVLTISF